MYNDTKIFNIKYTWWTFIFATVFFSHLGFLFLFQKLWHIWKEASFNLKGLILEMVIFFEWLEPNNDLFKWFPFLTGWVSLQKRVLLPAQLLVQNDPPRLFRAEKGQLGGGKAGKPPWQFGPNEFAKCLVGRKGANRSTQPKLLDRVELKARLHPELLGGKDKTCDSHGRYSQMMMSSPPRKWHAFSQCHMGWWVFSCQWWGRVGPRMKRLKGP